MTFSSITTVRGNRVWQWCAGIALLLFLPGTSLAGASSAPVALTLSSSKSKTPATEGHFTLSWSIADQKLKSTNPNLLNNRVFELQQAADANFHNPSTLYRGSDVATTISGRANGTWFYRVRDKNGPWSNIVHVTVQHHTLVRAFTFFGLGVFVVIVLVIIILRGTKDVA